MRVIRPAVTSVMVAALLLAVPSTAAAHAELASSDPAAGATLDEPPPRVVLTFGGGLDPDGSGFTVTDADGAEVGAGTVDLGVAERNVLRGTVAIEADGTYEVHWTAVAEDGHPEEGTFTFAVGGPVAPDTAMDPTVDIRPLGLILVGLAVMAMPRLALRGRRRR